MSNQTDNDNDKQDQDGGRCRICGGLLTHEHELIRGRHIGAFGCRHSLQAELRTAREENERLRSVLSFYADGQSYGINGGSSGRIFADVGVRARQALEQPDPAPSMPSEGVVVDGDPGDEDERSGR